MTERAGPRNFRCVNHFQTNGGEGFTITWTEHGESRKVWVATDAEAHAVCSPIVARILEGSTFTR